MSYIHRRINFLNRIYLNVQSDILLFDVLDLYGDCQNAAEYYDVSNQSIDADDILVCHVVSFLVPFRHT